MPLVSSTCRYGDEIIISTKYISYRNRLIDVSSIHLLNVKNNKFLINSYRQNNGLPTMCIHLKSHEDALDLYDVVVEQLFNEVKEELISSSSLLDWFFAKE